MRETRDLVDAWKRQPIGAPLVLATVIGNRGSTYRRAGARMLMGKEGWLAGTISGGCLEADLIQTAWERTKDGPALATYDSTTTEDLMWGFGLGCAGIIEVLVERLGPDGGPIPFLEERICS